MTTSCCAWIWIHVGLALALLELVVPGFVLCFFGLSSITVGVLKFVLGDSFGPAGQFAAFSVLSILYIVLLRRWLKQTFLGEKTGAASGLGSDYCGRLGRVVAAIEPPKPGRVAIGDAEWAAEADVALAVGADVKVVSQHNLTMKVEVI